MASEPHSSRPSSSVPVVSVGLRRKDRTLGLGIVAVSFAAALGISWWSNRAVQPEPPRPVEPPRSAGISGFPDRVEPEQALALARELTPRKLLLGWIAEGVKSDGTVNVSQSGHLRFSFQSAAGEGPQLPRPQGALPRRPYCGRQAVEVKAEGMQAEADMPGVACAAAPTESLPAPRCGSKEVWQAALKKGVPASSLARIEYYRSKAGPAWRLSVPGTPHQVVLHADCARELSPEESGTPIP